MTRTCLNWTISLSVLAFAAACGSSGEKSVGAGQTTLTNIGGKASAGGAGGVNYSVSAGGSGDVGGNGNGTLGGNGNTSDTSNGGAGEGSSLGGADSNGGAGGGGQDTSVMVGSGGSQDVRITGGTGNSVDVGTGGGSSQDLGTGGGNSIDVATGGASSVDLMTGGASSVDLMTGGASSVDLMTGGASSVDLGTGGAPSIDLGCTKTDLTNINVFVTMDATPNGADTEGNMYVGGDLIASGSYAVGAKNTKDCTHYTLVVGGDLALGSGSVNGGMAIVGGTASVDAVNFDCGLKRGAPPVDLVALKATVEELSRRYSQLASNGTVSKTSSALVLTGTDKTLNVFNVTAEQLNSTTRTEVKFPATSSVIVNVSGTNVNWGNGSVCLNGACDDSDAATNVVWNFYEAATLYSTGMAIQGSILAPFATLDGGGGHVAGQVIVQYLKGGLEYHPYYFDACIVWPKV